MVCLPFDMNLAFLIKTFEGAQMVRLQERNGCCGCDAPVLACYMVESRLLILVKQKGHSAIRRIARGPAVRWGWALG
jgi:hypothetical protein